MKTQLRVLCIEDDLNIALLVHMCLGRIGIDVDTEADGLVACIKLDQSDPPDCLLVDLMLPGMSGMEIIRHVRNDARFENMPIVVMSANVSEETRTNALALGVGHFLPKPFELEDLESLVRGVLASHG